jgi:hypothetical protein
MSVAWKQFHLAMYELAGPESQGARLSRAVAQHLSRLTEKDVPSEIRTQFVELLREVDALGRLDAVDFPDRDRDQRTASNIRSIISMYDALIRYQPTRKNV